MPKVALAGRFASLCFVVISLILSTLSPVQAFARDLTIALPANVNTLDPHNSTTVATDLSVISHIYTPLVDRGPDLKLRPGLATSWKAVDDRTWRFDLKPGITFPNGEPLDRSEGRRGGKEGVRPCR